MSENYESVYNELMKIKELNAEIYSRLLSTYGEELVNKVIEQMMDEKSGNMSKFDYYISKITAYDDNVSRELYEYYGIDLNMTPCFTKEENALLMNEIFLIVTELNTLINEIVYENELYDVYNKSWISDRIKLCVKSCNDLDKLEKLKKLSDKFTKKRNVIAEGNLRLVIVVVKKYSFVPSLFMESIQDGNMGLLKAVEKFDPTRNVTFATYAYYWIRQFITSDIHNLINPVYVPVHQMSIYYKMKKLERKMLTENGKLPSNKEIAECLDVSEEDIFVLKRAFNDSTSLYDPLGGVSDDEDSMLINFIVDENSSIDREIYDKSFREELFKIMDSCLNEKEKLVIMRRFGFYDGSLPTLEKVGSELGVTRERIRQIENKSLRKLQFIGNDLKGYLE